MNGPSELFKLLVARDIIEPLRGGAAKHMRWESVREQIDLLTDGYPFRAYEIKQKLKLYRGRKLRDLAAPYELPQMLSPPKGKVSDFGRCQKPGDPVMYMSSNVETVMGELRAGIGDIVQIAEFEVIPKEGFLYSIIGEYDFVRRHNFSMFGSEEGGKIVADFVRKMTEIGRLRLHMTDAFLAEEFRKFASTTHDYRITAAIAEEQYAQGFGGFVYPSVQHLGGMNFVLRQEHEAMAKCVSMQIVEITDVLGYGIFELRNLAEANKPIPNPISWDRHERKIAIHGSFLEFLKMILSISYRNVLLCLYLKESNVDGNVAFKVAGERHCRAEKSLTLDTFVEAGDQKKLDFDLLAFSFAPADGDKISDAVTEARKNFHQDYMKTATFDRTGKYVPLPLALSEPAMKAG